LEHGRSIEARFRASNKNPKRRGSSRADSAERRIEVGGAKGLGNKL
jgi:hypothetical protein